MTARCIPSSKPNSDSINGILQICKERHLLSVSVDYDVIYTTGPDVVSTYFNSYNLKNYLSKELSDEYLDIWFGKNSELRKNQILN